MLDLHTYVQPRQESPEGSIARAFCQHVQQNLCRGYEKGNSSSSTSSVAMIYYSLDPQFATLLFSVYSRNERVGCSLFPDPFCTTANASPPSSILTYAHTVGLQLIAIGEHYANFLSQVRAGSVIFLVGVGSLVCWKIWDYWNSGGGIDPSHPSPPPKNPSGGTRPMKSPTKGTAKTFFTSLLEEEFVHDFEDLEDDDPALIQHLIHLGRIYIKKIIAGKYFGPESPVESTLRRGRGKRGEDIVAAGNVSPMTSEYSAGKSHSSSTKQYLADNSVSYSADDDEGSLTSDMEDDSLPFDGSEPNNVRVTRRVKRRHHRNEQTHMRNSPNPRNCTENLPDSKNGSFASKRFHPYDRRIYSLEDFSSSETSPISRPTRHEMAKLRQSRLTSFQHRRDHLEMVDVDEFQLTTGKSQQMNLTETPPLYENSNSDEDWIENDSHQPNEDELAKRSRRSLSRELSLSDMIGRLRKKGSISRDNSVSSRLSDFLKRDDSICSNLSEFAYSECSEMSLDISLKDDSIANQTITSLADIEDELNTLKSSVLEMDEEFLKFASRPNPYLLKTTFSDYSFESGESRPHSALDVESNRARMHARRAAEHRKAISLSDELDNGLQSGGRKRFGADEEKVGCLSTPTDRSGLVTDVTDSQDEKDTKNRKPKQRRSSIENGLKISSQDESMPSLEWDNSGCLKQYDDERDISGDDSASNQLERLKFLPDYSSLELDLEKELQSPRDPEPTFSRKELFASYPVPSVNPSPLSPNFQPSVHSETSRRSLSESQYSSLAEVERKTKVSRQSLPLPSLSLEPSDTQCNRMTTSVDSAIGLHSAPDSRSGSTSPVSQLLTQSMMSSGIGTSLSELPTTTPDSENGNVFNKHGRFWGTQESGYVEGDNCLETSGTQLSPVHEISNNQSSDDGSQVADFEINGNISLENHNNSNSLMGNTTTSPEQDLAASSHLYRSGSSLTAIGEKQDILNYALAEWHGSTEKAQTMRKGYNAIPEELNLHNLQRIRGDNYCGIRAALFQILSSSLPIPNGYQIFNRLMSEVNRGSSWLKDYNFGRRLIYSRDQVVNGFKECLEALDQISLDLVGCENRECVLLSRLNNDSKLDIQLCEAAKLHMLASALDLYKEEVEGGHVPLFGMIMFARQSCLNPREFMVNHLNPVGDSAGLEQIEMFLLGHALQVTLQVVRPGSFGSDDFICFYPDENIGVWPEVSLIAEDDRHYNVLVK